MEIKRTGPWHQTIAALRRAEAGLEAIIDDGMRGEAGFFKRRVIQGIKRQAPGSERFRPLRRSTRIVRAAAGFGGARALLRSGELVASITLKKSRGNLFVGVPMAARGSDGRSLHMVARIAEHGSKQIVIPITPKMRRFLFAVLGGRAGGARAVSRGVIRFRIEPRPIFKPVMSRFGRPALARARMRKRLLSKLPRIFG